MIMNIFNVSFWIHQRFIIFEMYYEVQIIQNKLLTAIDIFPWVIIKFYNFFNNTLIFYNKYYLFHTFDTPWSIFIWFHCTQKKI